MNPHHYTIDDTFNYNLNACKGFQNIIRAFQTWIVLWNFAKHLRLMRYKDAETERVAFFHTLIQGVRSVSKTYDEGYIWRGFQYWGAILCAGMEGSLIGIEDVGRLRYGYTSPVVHQLPIGVRQQISSPWEWKLDEAIQADPEASIFHDRAVQSDMSKTLVITNGGYVGTDCNFTGPGW